MRLKIIKIQVLHMFCEFLHEIHTNILYNIGDIFILQKTKILILGAGYSGVHIAKKLAKKYKKNSNVEITLIDKNPFHTLMTELHEVAGGRVHPESVQIELGKIFSRTKVNVVTDYIEKVDTDKKTVTTAFGKYEYDYLVIGTGSEPAFFGVPILCHSGARSTNACNFLASLGYSKLKNMRGGMMNWGGSVER